MKEAMHKVACSRKELSCIIANLFSEVKPHCDCLCSELGEDDFALAGTLTGTEDDYAIIKLTDYGFDYYGDVEILNHIRGARCMLHRAVDPTEKNGGAAE